MLEVDGLALVQTDAILRYLGESSKKKNYETAFLLGSLGMLY